MKSRIKILLLLLSFSVMVFAQEKSDYSNDPGYADFGKLTQFQKGDDVTEVYIEKNLLEMVAKMSKKKDPDLSDLLSGIKLVKVNSFKVNETDQKSVMERIGDVDKKLTSENWQRIVRTKSKGEATNVYLKTSSNGEDIDGLVVTTISKNGEASFINIVGKINLETIGKLGDKFDIPSLEGIKRSEKKK